VRPVDEFVEDLAGAVLDGSTIDWSAVESSSDGGARPLVRHLRVLAAVAALARSGDAAVSSEVSPSVVALPDSEAPVLWGHLRLVERIGRGAFGEVYRAWDTRLDREVALKLLPADAAAAPNASSIIHEGRLLARVRHPNVVTIHGAEQIGNRIGLWMEHVRGHTLEQILEREKSLSATETAAIGLELCRAVSAVHGAGLLHRDIKSQNVMRSEDGRIVLMDFGAGRELDDDAGSDLAGTPMYLAPEVLQGQPATVRSDIYSLGVLLYHLVTGSYPVRARTVRELRAAHERGERMPVSAARRRGVPSKLARVIERAGDPRPERRYESAGALGAALAAAQPRPALVRLAYAAGAAAAFLVLAAAGWEAIGRRAGFATTPTALLASIGALPARPAAIDPAIQPTVAVLPFRNLSSEPDTDYFVDGLTEEIIRNLAVIDGLEVRSRSSSFDFKDKPRNLRAVAEQLRVNLVVEGSTALSGTSLRINARLVDVARDVVLWDESFDRNLTDVFAIQDEISRAIVDRLRLTLGRGQRRYSTNLEAYTLYLRGRELVDRQGTLAAQQAISVFEQVIARDPSFAPAHAGLAEAYAAASEEIRGPRGPAALLPDAALPHIDRAARTAVRLDPLLAEAHAAMGLLYCRRLDWQNAEQSFRRAIDLNPSLTRIHIEHAVSALIPLGKFAEAEQRLQSALRRDPLSLRVQRESAHLQVLYGRYDEAIGTLERIRAIDPQFPWINNYLGRALTFAGRPGDALRIWEPDKEVPGVQFWMARAYVMVGRRAEVVRMAATHDHPLRLAFIHAALGDRDRALEALDRAADVTPSRAALALTTPELAALRDDPRFAAVRRKLKLP
jgi:eukaryotic-like serine/threonine-protein kinase